MRLTVTGSTMGCLRVTESQVSRVDMSKGACIWGARGHLAVKCQDVFLEGDQVSSRETGYSGCLTQELALDDSTDLAGPNEVEQFNLALESFTSGKPVL